MMYTAYKLNKQGDNIQPFLIWNQSVVPCPVLTVASWPAYRFLKTQVRWSGIPISWRIFQFVVIYTVKGFGIVNKAEIDVFLELFCFLDDSTDVVNLISGSSAFSKTSLNIWKFTVHLLLKPGLENFGQFFTSVSDECNCAVVWAFFGNCLSLGLDWFDGPKNWCFWTVVLEKILESPLDSRRSNQSILKEISPEYSLEGLMLKLKLQYLGHLMQRTDSVEKTLMLGKIEGRRRRGRQRMRWLDGITNSMDMNFSKL